jgi:starvation-inducible DNA-binding protein
MHLLFDEFATAVLATVDDIAERIRMIGGDPVADPTTMLQLATVKVAAPKGTMRQMVAEADTNVIGVIKEMRDGAHLADQSHDPGTADLFARIVQIHEKHEWFLRDILEEGDGLVD